MEAAALDGGGWKCCCWWLRSGGACAAASASGAYGLFVGAGNGDVADVREKDGGAVLAARRVGRGKTVVNILCDGGHRTLSKFHNEECLRRRGLWAGRGEATLEAIFDEQEPKR